MTTTTRPAPNYTTGRAVRALRLAAAALSGAVITVALIAWPTAPQTVPTHVDATGTPDAWGPRWTLLVLLGVWAAMQILLTWLSTRPRLFNYPAPVTQDHAQAMYREGERMMVGVCLGVAIVFSGVVGMAYRLDTGAVVVIGLLLLVGGTIAGLIRTSTAASR